MSADVGSQRAYRVYLFLEFGWSFALMTSWTVAPIFYVNVIGANALQLALFGTIMEVTFFVLEGPTGVAADSFSRKGATVAGIATFGTAFLLQGVVHQMWAVIVGSVLFGVAWALVDGAVQAWIADEHPELDLGRVYLRGAQASRAGSLVGNLFSVALASLFTSLALIGGAVAFVLLALILIPAMPEKGFRRVSHPEGPWRGMIGTGRQGFRLARSHALIPLILGASFFYGFTSEGFDRLKEAHFLQNFELPGLGALKPIVWFGLMNAAGLVLSVGATEIARRKVDLTRHVATVNTMIAVNLSRVAALVVFGLAGSFSTALMAFLGERVLRAVLEPVHNAWLAAHANPSVRATVLSIGGMAGSIGEIAGGPILGGIGIAGSLRATMVAAGAFLIPATGILFGARGREVALPASGPEVAP